MVVSLAPPLHHNAAQLLRSLQLLIGVAVVPETVVAAAAAGGVAGSAAGAVGVVGSAAGAAAGATATLLQLHGWKIKYYR